jgi:hypothetical protein
MGEVGDTEMIIEKLSLQQAGSQRADRPAPFRSIMD